MGQVGDLAAAPATLADLEAEMARFLDVLAKYHEGVEATNFPESREQSGQQRQEEP